MFARVVLDFSLSGKWTKFEKSCSTRLISLFGQNETKNLEIKKYFNYFCSILAKRNEPNLVEHDFSNFVYFSEQLARFFFHFLASEKI